MPGHLFIVRGDITKLACDAWLASGAKYGPGSGWFEQQAVGDQPQHEEQRGRATFRGEVLAWQRHSSDSDSAPQPWYADVTREPVEQTMKFLRLAADAVGGGPAKNNRVKPLLAIPLPGVGKAGHKKRAGEVLAELLPAIHERLARADVDVDVALVLRTDPHYFAAQYVREQSKFAWGEVDDHHLDRLKFLAATAKQGQLVVFLGAGVSIGAGLPGWEAFLDELGRNLGADSNMLAEIKTLDVMDRPHALESVLRKQRTEHDSFKALIKSTIEAYGDRHSLNHAMLSVLPAPESVTTNYDRLFEAACTGADRGRYRIPWERPNGKSRWLLKMHGCVSEPNSIVLSRRDYSLYEAEHGILASIVQAMLVTRHMLFVGFGMNDPNFRSIFDTVKHALKQRELQDERQGQDNTFGTALFLRCSDVFQEIWKGDVDVLDFGGPTGPADANALAEAARRTEIAIDYLAAECCRDADVPLLDTKLFQTKVVDEGDLQRLEGIAIGLTRLRADCDGVKTPRLRELLVTKVQSMLDELGG